ncbi:alcohol dehydrogenase catalytic domain-containing protein [Kitasatospora sp. NPDC059722]|uniref:alcohol dehydrogenase catalytic domain-containing protein n=1 Tax=Kitasatospora sp. NPDC059722 TaxID=3346925 RepID=UPI0036B46CB1
MSAASTVSPVRPAGAASTTSATNTTGAPTPATHRALVRRAPDRHGRTLVDVAEVPTPALRPGDALLAPAVAGICGTDWQILRGLRDDPTPVLGHEGVAYVVEPGDTGLAPGTPVTVNPTHPDDPSFLLGHNLPGLWAELARIPASAVRAGLVVPVPDSAVRPRVASLAEPLASVLYGLRTTLHLVRPASLVVWGDGIVGRLATELWPRELPGLRVLLAGHGDGAVHPDDPALPALLAALPGPVAAVIATPRTGTPDALRALDRLVPGTLVVDVHAGLPSGPVELTAGPVDVTAVRAEHCGGAPWPPRATSLARPAGPLLLHGHRGVSGDHLREAVAHLTAPREALGRDVLTHEVGLDGAAELVNTVLTTRRRVADGRRVLKAAIRVAPPRDRQYGVGGGR